MTGRGDAAQIYTRSDNIWMRDNELPLPGVARSVIAQDGTVYVLTDYSIEVWRRAAPLPPPKRRATR